jgi:Sulfatase
MKRSIAIILVAALYSGALPAQAADTSALATRNVILLTADGVRIEELFGGIDASVIAHADTSGIYYEEETARVKEAYGAATPMASRERLMPFFWTQLARRGVIIGDKALGSSMRVTNKYGFSAPGYNELLTGRPHDDVNSNDVIRYPYPTALEYAQHELGLGFTDVAVIGSWTGFTTLASSKPDLFFTNTGFTDVPAQYATPKMQVLSEVQHRIMTLWPEGRSDAITFGIAREYLRTRHPRLLYIALGESDDWAHEKRYDRYLDYLHELDGMIGELWNTLQSLDAYRDHTTLIITTDHGRGSKPAEWIEHGEGITGSWDMWAAVIGPDTPAAGELARQDVVHQAQVAATVLRFLGLDYRDFDPGAAAPIAQAFK